MNCVDWYPGEVYKVALFYRYAIVNDVDGLMAQFNKVCRDLCLLGRILVSSEGINGTLAGSVHAIDCFEKELRLDDRFAPIDLKYSTGIGESLPFSDLSIRCVDEIISCGQAAREFIDSNIKFDPETFGGIVGTGIHLSPHEFHEGVQRDDALVLDIRNKFEYDIGHFDKAVGLGTFQYAETFDTLDNILSCEYPVNDNTLVADKPIYMYCTGGIRCEKASAYLKAKGFNNVYQLQGGIHKYLEAYPDGGNFKGKNFVFDGRVSMAPSEQTTDVTSSVTEGKVHGTIVGRCIDCNATHDEYSGSITCTVCRMPVLVCPTCVTDRKHPNEYHCNRHRDLKDVYFTVLNSFSEAELEEQRSVLQKMLDDCLADTQQFRVKSVSVATQKISKNDLLNKGKNRRRTLRRQIDKINARLLSIKEANETCASDSVNPMSRKGKGMWCDKQ